MKNNIGKRIGLIVFPIVVIIGGLVRLLSSPTSGGVIAVGVILGLVVVALIMFLVFHSLGKRRRILLAKMSEIRPIDPATCLGMIELKSECNIISVRSKDRSLALWRVKGGKPVEYKRFDAGSYLINPTNVALNAVKSAPGVSVTSIETGWSVKLLVVPDVFTLRTKPGQAEEKRAAINALVTASTRAHK